MPKIIYIFVIILSLICTRSAQDNNNETTAGNETDIIEKEEVELDKSQQMQSNNIIQFGRRLYIFELNKTANWFGAFNACRRNGTFLAHIGSPELMKVINDYLMSLKTTQQFWIAANTLEDQTKVVRLFRGQPLNYTNWADSHPDFNTDNGRCVGLGLNQMSTQYVWYGRNCHDNIHYICAGKNPEWTSKRKCIILNDKKIIIGSDGKITDIL